MNVVELKSILTNRIAEIDDLAFLKAIKTILDTKSEEKVIQLTSEQIAEINFSRKQFVQGLYTSQVDLDKELTTWLNDK